jgi:hypothetical protein
MNFNFHSSNIRPRTAGALLLVGVLAGVTVGGGVGVFAASSKKSVTVCVDKVDKHMNYSKNGKCKSHQFKLVLNQIGANGTNGLAGATGGTGLAGTNGTNGLAGATGGTGLAGTNGTNGLAGATGGTGLAGATGGTGLAGTNGTNGLAGTNGTNGLAGTNGTNGVAGATGAAGSSFTARSVCGSNGTTLCAIGTQGPGGGTVFFVDTEGRYADFDYLEVAPTDGVFASEIIYDQWSTSTAGCGVARRESCQSGFLKSSSEALNFLAIGTGRAATDAIINTHDFGGVVRSTYAAGVADAYTTATASDWFLPSKDELNEVCKYARNTNQAVGGAIVCSGGTLRDGFNPVKYWSSSERFASTAWWQFFLDGLQIDYEKTGNPWPMSVRPVRAF